MIEQQTLPFRWSDDGDIHEAIVGRNLRGKRYVLVTAETLVAMLHEITWRGLSMTVHPTIPQVLDQVGSMINRGLIQQGDAIGYDLADWVPEECFAADVVQP